MHLLGYALAVEPVILDDCVDTPEISYKMYGNTIPLDHGEGFCIPVSWCVTGESYPGIDHVTDLLLIGFLRWNGTSKGFL